MWHPAQVAFVIGGLRRQTSTLKPFNPILGETYQGQYSSGLRVFAEQISHHPPVSSWQVEDAEGKVRLSHTKPLALRRHRAQSAFQKLVVCVQMPCYGQCPVNLATGMSYVHALL